MKLRVGFPCRRLLPTAAMVGLSRARGGPACHQNGGRRERLEHASWNLLGLPFDNANLTARLQSHRLDLGNFVFAIDPSLAKRFVEISS